MSIYLAPTSNGLGSLISNLAAIDALVRRGDSPVLVLRSTAQKALVERIVGLRSTIMESDFSADRLNSGDSYINLRDHPLQTDHVWGSDEFARQFPGIFFEDVLETICHDKGIAIKLDQLTPLRHSPCPATVGKIVFVPGSNGPQKCWPVSHFLQLAEKLAAQGVQCVVVGEPQQSEFVKGCVEKGLPWHQTPDFGSAIDAVSAARAIVSVDTGLMHVAIHQGVPTVALFRKSNMFLKTRSHTRYLQAPPCAPDCQALQTGHANNNTIAFDSAAGFNAAQFYWLRWQCTEDEETRCMSQITSDSVSAALSDLLN